MWPEVGSLNPPANEIWLNKRLPFSKTFSCCIGAQQSSTVQTHCSPQQLFRELQRMKACCPLSSSNYNPQALCYGTAICGSQDNILVKKKIDMMVLSSNYIIMLISPHNVVCRVKHLICNSKIQCRGFGIGIWKNGI